MRVTQELTVTAPIVLGRGQVLVDLPLGARVVSDVLIRPAVDRITHWVLASLQRQYG